MPSSHAPFTVLNAVVNPIVRGVLRSPIHRLLSGSLVLISVTGRHTGRVHTIPVGYSREGDTLVLRAGAPSRKRWWRNLRAPAPVVVQLCGERRTGIAQARGDERSGVTVEVRLDPAA